MIDATFALQSDEPGVLAPPRRPAKAKPASIAGRVAESRQFWMIYALTISAFFFAALVMRLLRLGQASPVKSTANLFSEAHELACQSIPYAFMG